MYRLHFYIKIFQGIGLTENHRERSLGVGIDSEKWQDSNKYTKQQTKEIYKSNELNICTSAWNHLKENTHTNSNTHVITYIYI